MTLLLAILALTHLIADGFLQSREMGRKKSTEFKWLSRHLGILFLAFFIVLSLVTTNVIFALVFSTLNTVVHGIIDWNIWRLYKLHAWKVIQKQASDDMAKANFTDGAPDYDGWYKYCVETRTKNFEYWNDPWFYHTIMTDQFLHLVTIYGILFLMLGV